MADDSARIWGFYHQEIATRNATMADVLNVSKREALGTSNTRRLRKTGQIPAILYGHGKECINLTIPSNEVESVIRHGTKVIDIVGAASDSVLINEIQWDPLGLEILHVDLTRVSADETVLVTIIVELRGEAPGTKQGGVVDHQLHEIEIECPAGEIPDRLSVSINKLELGDTIAAGDIEIPLSAKLMTPNDQILVQCVEPTEDITDEEGAESQEPEIIGRKAEGEEDAGE
jgi:large subunit ribosomal protein L25